MINAYAPLFAGITAGKGEKRAPVVAANLHLKVGPVKLTAIPSRTGRKINSAPCDFASVPDDREIQQLMDRVVNTDVAAEGELKQLLRPGVAFLLRYSLGDRKPLESAVEEVLSLATLGVQTQKLKEAPELLAFVVQTAKHCLDAPSKEAVTMEARAQVAAMNKALARMSPTQRKAISAYYLEHKAPDEIELEFGIPADVFRKLISSIRLRYKDSQGKIEELIQQLRDQRQQLTKLIAELNREK